MRPEFPTLRTVLQEPHALLKVAQARFDDVWNSEGLPQMLTSVADRGAVTPVELETLRRLRKRGLEVRTGLEMLTTDQKAPKSFRRFLKAIGDTKDDARIEGVGEIDSECIQTYLDHHEAGVLPCVLSAQECLARMQDIVKMMRIQLREKKLSFPEFHDLRKEGTRHIANVYRLHKRFHKTVPAKEAFAYWDGINRRLGKVQDAVITLERLPKKERKSRMHDLLTEEWTSDARISPRREIVRIEPVLREEILNALHSIRE